MDDRPEDVPAAAQAEIRPQLDEALARVREEQANRPQVGSVDLHELLKKPVITPAELYQARILPLSLNGIYQSIARGEIETIPVGRRKKGIVTASLRRRLGL